MRRPIIAGNWKMHKTVPEAKDLIKAITSELVQEKRGDYLKNVEIVICPPFTTLSFVYAIIKDSSIFLGAQNMYFETEGAYTGEISPLFLTDIGCKYVILGHSERRQYFKETDEIINKKLKMALKNGLIPIVCIGETLDERERGETEKVIESQFTQSLKELDIEEFKNIVIAYEPIWAIGTGETATPEMAEQVHEFIRNLIKDKYGTEIAEDCRILYGGSVKPDNIKGLMVEQDIDGGLIGGASLKPESFIEIVKIVDSLSR